MTWSNPFKPRKPMNRSGKVTRRRLALVAELTETAKSEGWYDRCEVAEVLRARGITFRRCSGMLTFAHSVKSSPRGLDHDLDREVARACWTHHAYCLDLLPPAQTAEIVRQAIAWRKP